MSLCNAQTPVAPANYDEEKVPRFAMPDALVTFDGRIVNTPELWNDVRRPELLAAFAEEMYGKIPLLPHVNERGVISMTVLEKVDADYVFDGKAIRWQIRVRFMWGPGEPRPSGPPSPMREDDPKIYILIYTPTNVEGPIPAFLGLNFQGNHTVDNDPGILLNDRIWNTTTREYAPATEERRGNQRDRWQIEKVIDRGYATITAYYQDIEPDFNGGHIHGFRRYFVQQGEPSEGNTIATWAWGLSLIYNIVTGWDEGMERRGSSEFLRLNIDPNRIILHGHSRLGKAALWAGAVDERFAMVISNNSGCGGAALTRREFGETVHRINTSFPHWFNENFKKYNHDVNSLPFDQHELIALIAPRPVYIASAVEDQWADPRGEFLSALHADPVYRLLGTDGFAGVTEMPGVNQPVGGTIGYHIRTGVHDVTAYDWEQWLDFADKHLK